MHQNSWQLQQAKAQLSELVKKAATNGPQEITVRGNPCVMVISKKTYDQLKKKKPSLGEFLISSPISKSALKIDRDTTQFRDIE